MSLINDDLDQQTVPLYIANPAFNNEGATAFFSSSSSSPPRMPAPFFTPSNVPLTPIPEVTEISLRSSIDTYASNGSLPLSINANRLPTRLSLENSPRDSNGGLHRSGEYQLPKTGGPQSPSSAGSASLNEFLRLEEQESIGIDDFERQLMEGQEGDQSLVESVVEGMREGEAGVLDDGDDVDDVTMTSFSRSLGPSGILVTGSGSISMSLSSFTSLPHPGTGSGGALL